MTNRRKHQPETLAWPSRPAIVVFLILILSPMMGAPALAHDGAASIRHDGSLYGLSRVEERLHELTSPDRIATGSAMPSLVLRSPQDVLPALSSKPGDDPLPMNPPSTDNSLGYGPGHQTMPGRIGRSSEPALVPAATPEATMFQALLVQTIDTSLFSPPSPDPAGIAYLDSSNTLLIADSEVDEMPIFAGDNLFEITLAGGLLSTWNTIPWSYEPTGAGFDPSSGHLFLSDDDRGRIFEIDPGPDGLYGTGDDVITTFSTRVFGSYDPEGVAFAQRPDALFIADGITAMVYQVRPGANGRFDGVPPGGDDQVTSFDTAGLGITDPEGIAFNPENGHLYLGDQDNVIAEATRGGTLVQMIDISAANAIHLAGLACGPSSLDPEVMHIYIADRGLDNDQHPDENDGKVYEMTLPPTTFRIYLPSVVRAGQP